MLEQLVRKDERECRLRAVILKRAEVWTAHADSCAPNKSAVVTIGLTRGREVIARTSDLNIDCEITDLDHLSQKSHAAALISNEFFEMQKVSILFNFVKAVGSAFVVRHA